LRFKVLQPFTTRTDSRDGPELRHNHPQWHCRYSQ
jgi:hypothetical protein